MCMTLIIGQCETSRSHFVILLLLKVDVNKTVTSLDTLHNVPPSRTQDAFYSNESLMAKIAITNGKRPFICRKITGLFRSFSSIRLQRLYYRDI